MAEEVSADNNLRDETGVAGADLSSQEFVAASSASPQQLSAAPLPCAKSGVELSSTASVSNCQGLMRLIKYMDPSSGSVRVSMDLADKKVGSAGSSGQHRIERDEKEDKVEEGGIGKESGTVNAKGYIGMIELTVEEVEEKEVEVEEAGEIVRRAPCAMPARRILSSRKRKSVSQGPVESAVSAIGIPAAGCEQNADLMKALYEQGWSYIEGIGLPDWYYLPPNSKGRSATDLKKNGTKGSDYFTSLDAVRESEFEGSSSPRDRRKTNPVTHGLVSSVGAIGRLAAGGTHCSSDGWTFHTLKDQGWGFLKGKGIIDFLYLPPKSVKPVRTFADLIANGVEGDDYFLSEEAVREFDERDKAAVPRSYYDQGNNQESSRSSSSSNALAANRKRKSYPEYVRGSSSSSSSSSSNIKGDKERKRATASSAKKQKKSSAPGKENKPNQPKQGKEAQGGTTAQSVPKDKRNGLASTCLHVCLSTVFPLSCGDIALQNILPSYLSPIPHTSKTPPSFLPLNHLPPLDQTRQQPQPGYPCLSNWPSRLAWQ